jgi:hypothetical protein
MQNSTECQHQTIGSTIDHINSKDVWNTLVLQNSFVFQKLLSVFLAMANIIH